MTKQLELLHGVKRWTLMAAVFAFVSIPMPQFAAIPPQTIGETSISEVAKKSTPAVVSINVKFRSQDRSASFLHSNDRYYPDDPFDPFLQEFFGFRPRKFREAPGQRIETGQASGFIVSQDGYIITNAHVVQDASEVSATLTDGREFRAKIVGTDPSTDIAIVKIDAHNLPYLTLGNSDGLEVGQWVVAVGNPIGLQTSVTAGIVSAKGRNNLSLAKVEDFIQTDAAINRGNSGGPLLNLKSEVIGMNTAIVTHMGSGGYMGIGFAIPSNMIHQIMEELIQNGSVTRGFMGVSLQHIDYDLAQAFGLDKTEGALVSEVSKNSPAEKAGIKQGDVILEYNNRKIENIAALRNAIALMKPGSKVNLLILRNGRPIQTELTIGTNPEDGRTQKPGPESRLGLEVETLTPEMAKKMGVPDLTGVLIKSLKTRSAAALAGLRPGSVIAAVNHQEVQSAEEFYEALNRADPNRPLLLLVQQGAYIHFVSIKTH